jgi:hypothetical protein
LMMRLPISFPTVGFHHSTPGRRANVRSHRPSWPGCPEPGRQGVGGLQRSVHRESHTSKTRCHRPASDPYCSPHFLSVRCLPWPSQSTTPCSIASSASVTPSSTATC